MPHITTPDGTRLYYEEVGAGSPVVFVHEYAGDYRTWEPQLRYFARAHRCIAVLDALKIDKAHIVGHSMGAYTALHVGMVAPKRCLSVVAAGCGWGSLPDPKASDAMKVLAAETGKMFAEEGIVSAAAKYADAPMRQAQKHKDPRGWAEFARMLSEHSATGHAHTMLNLQLKRPTLWEMEAELKQFSVPLLVIVGDEDDLCLDGSVFIKRTAPTAALLVVPRAGHTINSEEPAAVNAALAELFAAAEAGRWLAHKPA